MAEPCCLVVGPALQCSANYRQDYLTVCSIGNAADPAADLSVMYFLQRNTRAHATLRHSASPLRHAFAFE